jgi:hypothetical protein
MAVLDAEAFDQLGRLRGGGRELLAEPLGKRRGECVDLADGRLAVT